MAQRHYKAVLKKVLLGFIMEKNPVPAMPERVSSQIISIQGKSMVIMTGSGSSSYMITAFL